jgi:hypothetical protein
MHRKNLTLVILVFGIFLVIASMLADAIGLGGSPGFGFRQILGTATGLLLIVVGIAARRRAK